MKLLNMEKESLREKFFRECTYKPESGLIMRQHAVPPNITFEWFEKEATSLLSQRDEEILKLKDGLNDILRWANIVEPQKTFIADLINKP